MSKMSRKVAFGVLMMLCAAIGSSELLAQVPPAPLAPAAAPAAAAAQKSNDQFTGWGFGAGLSVTYDTGSRDRISDAAIDSNGIVRVNKRDNARARVMLETHYLFPYRKNPPAGTVFRSGWGPFVAAQPGDDEIIKAVGIGLMFGWRRVPADPVQAAAQAYSQSFNLGIGFVVDPSTKTLGNEFQEDGPAPLSPDGAAIPIRFQEREQGGILAMASFSW